jgi:hypothetical protein
MFVLVRNHFFSSIFITGSRNELGQCLVSEMWRLRNWSCTDFNRDTKNNWTPTTFRRLRNCSSFNSANGSRTRLSGILNVHRMRTKKRSCGPSKGNLKFTKLQKLHCNWPAICARLRKRLSPWSNRSLQTNFKSAVIINYVRSTRRHSRATNSPRVRPISTCVQCTLCFCHDSRSMYVQIPHRTVTLSGIPDPKSNHAQQSGKKSWWEQSNT